MSAPFGRECGRVQAMNGTGRGRRGGAPPEQLALIRESVRQAKGPGPGRGPGGAPRWPRERPVARVLVDKGVLHLDRYFDYAVPEECYADAQPGCGCGAAGRAARVRRPGREGGGLIDGFLVERVDQSTTRARWRRCAQVVSPSRCSARGVAGLAPTWPTGTRGAWPMCLQLAVPPRSARAEKQALRGRSAARRPEPGSWDRYERGAAFLESLAAGGAPRAVWNAAARAEVAASCARAVAATLASGRGALVVVPDGRAVGASTPR